MRQCVAVGQVIFYCPVAGLTPRNNTTTEYLLESWALKRLRRMPTGQARAGLCWPVCYKGGGYSSHRATITKYNK